MKQLSNISKLSISIILSSLLMTAAFADATLHFRQKGDAMQPQNSSIYIKYGKIRFSDSDAKDGEYSIFDSLTNKISHVNPTRRVYMEMDEKSFDNQLSAAKSQMDLMMAQMQQQMKNMPPEQRQMMEQMMGSAGNAQIPGMPRQPSPKQIKTNKTETIAGIQCTIIETWLGSARQEESCVTDENKLSIDSADKKTITRMNQFIKTMSQKASSFMGGQSLFEQFDGVPLRTRKYSPTGTLLSETVLHSISKNDVSVDKVTVPINYQKQSIAQGF